MLLYALRRLIYLVPVAFGVSLLVFALVHLAPGDPISAIVPPDAPKEVVDKLKEYYGFDKPLPVQYIRWLTVTLSGDFGTSIGTGRPVVDEVSSAFGNTIILAIAACLLAFSLAIILGSVAAYAKLNNQGLGRYSDFNNMHKVPNLPQAHGAPGFLPWHRAYLLDLERELQAIDPSVALPYWRFDQPAPNVFTRDFMGESDANGTVKFRRW